MNIKQLRTAAGLNRKQFAEYFNIPYRTIEDWEAQRRTCPSYLLELIKYKLKKEGFIF